MAAALSLSKNLTICVPLKEEYLATLKYSTTFFKGFEILDYIPAGIPIYEEPFHHYATIPYTEGADLIIKGYFQSYKYINRSKALEQFSIDQDTYTFIKSHYPVLFNKKITSIHVRRGDYLRMLHKHPFSGLSYYLKAIEQIGKNENFIVVSDDIGWCKKNLKLANVIFVENTSPIIDLYIQSFCVNNIISNSSFSWWGAFLNEHNDKKVIMPSLWFGHQFKVDISDLIPPSYIVIKNKYSMFLYLKSLIQVISQKIFS
ncbi:alpha-1,2-fucosyltransferase [Pedobacter sp. AJM]|uniref:alpha-1,2-fucosyltransferase n=1 Tax=Pedobacter sp. AJM TaxID=2003629 RepID=UPI0015520AC9|nr:alpha-1,2-fucosyltransferase [Pedobacter sp. AJM]